MSERHLIGEIVKGVQSEKIEGDPKRRGQILEAIHHRAERSEGGRHALEVVDGMREQEEEAYTVRFPEMQLDPKAAAEFGQEPRWEFEAFKEDDVWLIRYPEADTQFSAPELEDAIKQLVAFLETDPIITTVGEWKIQALEVADKMQEEGLLNPEQEEITRDVDQFLEEPLVPLATRFQMRGQLELIRRMVRELESRGAEVPRALSLLATPHVPGKRPTVQIKDQLRRARSLWLGEEGESVGSAEQAPQETPELPGGTTHGEHLAGDGLVSSVKEQEMTPDQRMAFEDELVDFVQSMSSEIAQGLKNGLNRILRKHDIQLLRDLDAEIMRGLTDWARGLVKGIQSESMKEQGGDILHRDLFMEWLDKKKHYESLPDDSPQKSGAELNMSYAKGQWEKAVLASAMKVLQRK